jgi:hypothetical protein
MCGVQLKSNTPVTYLAVFWFPVDIAVTLSLCAARNHLVPLLWNNDAFREYLPFAGSELRLEGLSQRAVEIVMCSITLPWYLGLSKAARNIR